MNDQAEQREEEAVDSLKRPDGEPTNDAGDLESDAVDSNEDVSQAPAEAPGQAVANDD